MAAAHLYRAEMHRMSVWRQRLDVTTNRAVILATALTTFTLGAPEVPHYTLLLGLALVIISILLEGRRYRHLCLSPVSNPKQLAYCLQMRVGSRGSGQSPPWERHPPLARANH
jgi:hypothetical protein